MHKILKLLLSAILVFNVVSLQASSYNNDILEIISKIIPRFVLMSSQKDKLEKSINICLIHEKQDKNSVDLLIDKIEKNNPHGINNFTLQYIKTDFNNLDSCKTSHISFIFDTNTKNIENTLKILNNYKVLTMSYDEKYLKYGVGISLYIGKKVLPYLNIDAIYSKQIQIDNILLRVSKIYKENSE